MAKERFKSLTAILIALVTILGASAVCLSTVAVSQASDEDFLGMSAAIDAQRAEVINQVNAYEHYRAFTSYRRYLELGNLLLDQASTVEEAIAAQLDSQRLELWGLAGEMRHTFFLPRYLEQDGTYDIKRELDEAWAEDMQGDDLNPGPHFERSDSLRRRSAFLAGDMIVFALSFWFLTLAQVTETRWKYLWSTLGILAGLGGILGILIAQVLL